MKGRLLVAGNTTSLRSRARHTPFLGVKCVEVHDKVSVDGVLTEDTLDWFAQDKTGNVWYFGEESKQLEDGIVIGIEGSWQAGVDDAKPGIVMGARPRVGDVYRQEYAISDAEDMAEVFGLGQSIQANGKMYAHVLVTHEFSGLEPAAQRTEVLRAEPLALCLSSMTKQADRSSWSRSRTTNSGSRGTPRPVRDSRFRGRDAERRVFTFPGWEPVGPWGTSPPPQYEEDHPSCASAEKRPHRVP